MVENVIWGRGSKIAQKTSLRHQFVQLNGNYRLSCEQGLLKLSNLFENFVSFDTSIIKICV